MSEQLIAWCKEEKLGSMPQNWQEIKKLLGRTRRMIDNRKREVGVPRFYALQEMRCTVSSLASFSVNGQTG